MKKIHLAFYGLLLFTLSSCEKVIDVDLNSSDPQYVIEAEVSDGSGPYTVKITRSKNFDEDNSFPGVTGVQVLITDLTAGYTDTLTETPNGIYLTNTLTGVPGHTYQLYIKASDKELTATSSMPAPVALDTFYAERSPWDDDLDIVPVYTDPAGRGNYYQIVKSENRRAFDMVIRQKVYVRDDEITDGERVAQTLRGGFGEGGNSVDAGDTVTIELRSIDFGVYQYYNSLILVSDDQTATPANPISNINGGALGYFNAHTVSRRTQIISE